MDITASSITFVTSAYSAYGRIKKIRGLPKEFDEVENRLPLATDTLKQFKSSLGSDDLEPEAKKAIEKLLTPCEANAKKLKDIFEGIQKHDGDNGLSRYRIVVLKIGKASRVEVLLQSIMKSLQELAINHEARMANLLPKLSSAVAALSKVKSSVPDEDFEEDRKSSFTQHNASGATGQQTVNNVNGPQTNNSGGTHYNSNGGAMHFGSESHLRERRNAVLRQLDKNAYRAAKDRNRRPVEGTCRWVVEHNIFQEWKNKPSSTLLWLSADPGCGKSVLARHLVDTVLAGHNPHFFFFKDGYSGQTTADSALGCILHQILAARYDLLSEEILCRFEGSSQIYQSADELWDVLQILARAIGYPIICVLDAFDECKDEDRDVLSRLLRGFYAHRSAASNLKFLVTSRPYDNIKQKFRIAIDIPIIHLNGETPEESQKIAKEIDIFMESEIAEMEKDGRLSAGDADSLRTWMHGVTNRTYLWAHLVLAEINHRPGEHFALVLSGLPKTVNDAYEKMLAKTSKKYNRERVEKLLHIVLAATRPLSIEEMYIALTINKQHQRPKDIGSPGNNFETYIRELCGLFVYIVDSKVYLFHQTAREFLVPAQNAQDSQHPPAEGSILWQHSLERKASNRVLYEACAWYLLLTDATAADPEVSGLFQLPVLATTADLAERFKTYKFYEYCATSWAHHYRFSETRDLDLSLKLLPQKRNPSESSSGRPWLDAYWMLMHRMLTNESFTPLIVASYFGLVNVVRHLTSTSTRDINKVELHSCRSALSFAAENGFTEVVRCLLLINRKVLQRFLHLRRLNIDSTCSEGQTPLMYAASNGHVETVRLLIGSGAKTDVCDTLDQTALSYALACGHSSVVRELAGKDSVDNVSEITQSLMFKAVRKESYAVVTRLLANGADVDGRDPQGLTPLIVAISERDDDMVRLLLDNGASPDLPDATGSTPYFHAKLLHDDMARTILDRLDPADFTKYNDPRQLLNTKAPSDVSDGYVRDAFVDCFHAGYDEIATQLFNCHRGPLSSYISIDCPWSNDCFLKLLQKKMARTNILTRTRLLREALQMQSVTAAEFLVNSGVDLEERDYEGRTVIFDALHNTNLLQMIIKAGASTKTHDFSGLTPLHVASLKKVRTNLWDILGNLAEINARNVSPLAVAHLSHDRTTQLLLESGADTEARTKAGKTVLEMAIESRRPEVVKCLLIGGVDANAVISTGERPLRYAQSILDNEDRFIQRVLEEYGATDG